MELRLIKGQCCSNQLDKPLDFDTLQQWEMRLMSVDSEMTTLSYEKWVTMRKYITSELVEKQIQFRQLLMLASFETTTDPFEIRQVS